MAWTQNKVFRGRLQQSKEVSLCFEDTSLSSQLDLVVPKKQQAKHLILHIALNFLTRIWEKLTPSGVIRWIIGSGVKNGYTFSPMYDF